MFRVSTREAKELSQSVIGEGAKLGGSLPLVFTQEGVAMLSSVLRSAGAVKVNVAIMRAFVQLRTALAEHGELRRKLDDMEQRYDEQFTVVFDAIRQLMEPPLPKHRKRIGF
jgi:hypothetical protein